MIGYLLLLVISLLTCIGQLCQKQAANHWQQAQCGQIKLCCCWLLTALMLLGLAMLLWLKLLQHMPLSQAYPLLSFNFILMTLAGRFFFAEQVTSRHWLGIAAIMLGILLLSWH